jgi:hypothetical protein
MDWKSDTWRDPCPNIPLSCKEGPEAISQRVYQPAWRLLRPLAGKIIFAKGFYPYQQAIA